MDKQHTKVHKRPLNSGNTFSPFLERGRDWLKRLIRRSRNTVDVEKVKINIA